MYRERLTPYTSMLTISSLVITLTHYELNINELKIIEKFMPRKDSTKA